MPVAIEVAEVLSQPLHVLVVEKIWAPLHEAWQSNQSIGVAAQGGVCVFDSKRISALQIPAVEVDQAAAIAQNDQAHKEEIYRRGCPATEIRGLTVILIDDALDSGATMQAAVQALRQGQPARIVVAAPVGSATACRQLSGLVDQVICPVQPAEDAAIHDCYGRFPPLTDSDALGMIENSGKLRASGE